ncbi:DUF6804 family protein [Lacibacter sediminis]|uniref:Uncharacterized protein n=1 Tax=Lacibacter sediminis TaxID=2760713 RepID=A0A7G5XFP7_9BACT|nr:DUF6804 family protein [Lacibacter sediminis]QNA44300.1 hypothetical protein H4075_19895 [Lacibacter sediminis]
MNINLLKIVLALLLFACLLQMPYGYYQLVRFLAMAFFAYFAYETFLDGRKSIALLYIFLAILFQPIVKIALGRLIWNIVDVIVGVVLIISVISQKKKLNN